MLPARRRPIGLGQLPCDQCVLRLSVFLIRVSCEQQYPEGYGQYALLVSDIRSHLCGPVTCILADIWEVQVQIRHAISLYSRRH